jgi:hypothetical protein
MEVVLPDADAATEPDEIKSAATAADDAAALAAADSAAEAADEELVIKARLSITENAARLAFGG